MHQHLRVNPQKFKCTVAETQALFIHTLVVLNTNCCAAHEMSLRLLINFASADQLITSLIIVSPSPTSRLIVNNFRIATSVVSNFSHSPNKFYSRFIFADFCGWKKDKVRLICCLTESTVWKLAG